MAFAALAAHAFKLCIADDARARTALVVCILFCVSARVRLVRQTPTARRWNALLWARALSPGALAEISASGRARNAQNVEKCQAAPSTTEKTFNFTTYGVILPKQNIKTPKTLKYT